MSATFRVRLSMALAMAIGLGYLVWLAWAEGWRLLVIAGVMALVGILGGLAHLAMGLAREHQAEAAREKAGAPSDSEEPE